MRRISKAAFGLATLTLAFTGCGREEVRSYRIPKEDRAAAPVQAAAKTEAPATTTGEERAIHWDTPEGWQTKPGSSMRVGSFAVTGSNGGVADISVIPITGDSGTEIDNVNRWRGQVSLAPVAADEAARLGDPIKIGGHASKLYEFSGIPKDKTKPERTLVASVRHQDAMWFFKASGDDETVKAEKPRFVAFLNSVHFHDDTPTQTTTTAEPAPAAAPAKEGAWKIPATWTETAPGAMQQAKFLASGDAGAKAEVTISIFPSMAGGALMNVNRWRGQIQLPPVTEADLPKLTETIDAPSGKITVYDMKNDANGKRLVAAVLNRTGETWYVKLMGDASVVGRERDAFLKFVRDPK